MKKVISILLVAMLIIGMFPATTLTAFAADTEIVFALGENGSASHNDGNSKTSYSETVGNYTLSLTGGTNMYTGARDLKGNSCIKLGTSSKTGGFSFTVPSDVTSVVIAIAKYKANTTKITVNGTAYTLSNSSNNGEYDEITVDTSSNQTVNLTTVSGGVRAMVNTITFVIAGGSTEPEEPACEHTNTELQDAAEASCTVDGYTGDEVCLDCGEVVTEGEVIPAGHNYVDGECSVCGAAEPAGYAEADVASLSNVDQVLVTVTNADNETYALTSGNGTSKAPVATKVTVTNGVIAVDDVTDALIWNVVYSGGNIEIYPNGTTATWLYCTNANNGVRVGTNSNKVFTIDSDSGYLKNTATSRYLGVYNAQDWRCYTSPATANIANQVLKFYKLSDSAAEDCEHTNTEIIPAVAATCSSTGLTEGIKCSDCDKILTAQEPTPVRQHNMVNGICAYEDCGMYEQPAELMTALPGNGDKIIIHHIKNNLALGLEVVQNDDLAGISTTPVDGKLTYYTSVAQLTVGLADGEFTFQNAEGKYLTTDKGNAIYFADTLTDNGKWVITLDNGVFIIDNAYAANDTGTLTLEVYGGAFTSYSYGDNNPSDAYKMHLYLVEKGAEACQHPNAQEQSDGYAAQCGVPGMTNSWYCPDCEITVIPQTEIPALEHNYVDGICINEGCGAPDPMYTLPGRYYIAATRNNGSYYMTSDLGTKSTKRYTAVETGLETLPTEITDPEFGYVFIVTRNQDGTFSIQAEGIPGDNYLGWSSGNSGILTADKNINFTATANEDGTFTFANSANRYLSLNNSGDNWFAWYESVQKRDLTLIPVTGAETSPAAETDGRYFATVEEAITAAAEENKTVKLLADVVDISVTGDLSIDLNGNSVESLTVTGTLKAHDSQATTAAASGAMIESVDANEVVMDNTVNGVRYIALETDGAYTFHVLQMQLTAVTLRTEKAGIYYKAKVICDPELLAATTQYGIALSTQDMPGADFATEKIGDKNMNAWTYMTNDENSPLLTDTVFTSGSVFNILKEGLSDTDNSDRGQIDIYANAYIIVNGVTVMADLDEDQTVDTDGFDGAAFSLLGVMLKLEESFDNLEAEVQTRIAEFYAKWSGAMSTWELPKISAAAQQLPAEA